MSQAFDEEKDVFSNLKKAILPNGKVIEYLVDGQNRRVAKKVNGIITQMFLYQSQLQIAAELDGSGKIIRRYVYGSKPNVPDYYIENGISYRIIADHLGSPRLIVDAVSGKIIDVMSFDEFGILQKQDDPYRGIKIPFGFAGGIYDQDTGLVRFGARDYNPELGRWTTKDPIGFSGGDTNLFSYALSNPVNFNDPSGLFIFDFDGVIPSWIKNTPIYKQLDSALAIIIISNKDLSAVDAFGETLTSAFGRFQSIGIDVKANAGNDSQGCDKLTGLEDTILHELNHARQNLNRYAPTYSDEANDNLLLPALLSNSIIYKK